MKIDVFNANSMVSGPTNSRWSEKIGDDRRGTGLSQNLWKNRDVGLELAYKCWSLTIAEDRGRPEILGVTQSL
jgi:hypothetical protein